MKEKELQIELSFDFFKKVKGTKKERPFWEKVLRGILWGVIGSSSILILIMIFFMIYIANF